MNNNDLPLNQEQARIIEQMKSKNLILCLVQLNSISEVSTPVSPRQYNNL
jgi:hypothetical protein